MSRQSGRKSYFSRLGHQKNMLSKVSTVCTTKLYYINNFSRWKIVQPTVKYYFLKKYGICCSKFEKSDLHNVFKSIQERRFIYIVCCTVDRTTVQYTLIETNIGKIKIPINIRWLGGVNVIYHGNFNHKWLSLHPINQF